MSGRIERNESESPNSQDGKRKRTVGAQTRQKTRISQHHKPFCYALR